MQAAKRHGTIVSYDLNYRPSLWKSIGGKQQAQDVNRRIAPLVDVMLGNEEDFSAALGYEVAGVDASLSDFEVASFKQMIEKVVKDYPFQVVATTLRKAKTATRNDWGAICYSDGNFYQAKERKDLEIYDRVGGGDSFASGLIYGFLAGKGPQFAVECGAAHGALAMTTPGDTSMVTLPEVLRVMKTRALASRASNQIFGGALRWTSNKYAIRFWRSELFPWCVPHRPQKRDSLRRQYAMAEFPSLKSP